MAMHGPAAMHTAGHGGTGPSQMPAALHLGINYILELSSQHHHTLCEY